MDFVLEPEDLSSVSKTTAGNAANKESQDKFNKLVTTIAGFAKNQGVSYDTAKVSVFGSKTLRGFMTATTRAIKRNNVKNVEVFKNTDRVFIRHI